MQIIFTLRSKLFKNKITLLQDFVIYRYLKKKDDQKGRKITFKIIKIEIIIKNMRRVHNVEKLWGCNINNFTLLLQ